MRSAEEIDLSWRENLLGYAAKTAAPRALFPLGALIGVGAWARTHDELIELDANTWLLHGESKRDLHALLVSHSVLCYSINMPGRRKIKHERHAQWIRFVIKLILLLALLELFLWLLSRVFLTRSTTNEYIVVGVSGGLQDGFPERSKLDFDSADESDPVPAIFLGRALVRGYKAFLDVMEPSWRQYVVSPCCIVLEQW